MRSSLVGSLCSLSLVIGLQAAPAEAAMRKCTANAHSRAPFDSSKLMVMVDGDIVGEMPPGAVRVSYIVDGMVYLVTAEVTDMTIVCIEQTSATGPVLTQVVSVLTKEGSVQLAEAYLNELASMQEAFRRIHGRYAANATELGFYLTRAPLPVEMSVSSGGFSASISPAGTGATCRIAVDAEHRGNRASRLADCFEGRGGTGASSASERLARQAVLRASPVARASSARIR